MIEENAEQGTEQDFEHQTCPLCNEKALILNERETEVPYFGRLYLFSMSCNNCKYHKADVEAVEEKEPVKYEFEISSEEDMKVRVVKSSEASIKLPHLAVIAPGPASQGYVTNIEGILNRVKYQIEAVKEMEEEDEEDRKKAKDLLKKITRIMEGQEKQKLLIEDPSGNSAIISDKAIKSPLKVKVEKQLNFEH